jgi:hypothetical protein
LTIPAALFKVHPIYSNKGLKIFAAISWFSAHVAYCTSVAEKLDEA